MKIVNSVNPKSLNYDVSKKNDCIDKIVSPNTVKTGINTFKSKNIEMVNLSSNNSIIDEIKTFFLEAGLSILSIFGIDNAYGLFAKNQIDDVKAIDISDMSKVSEDSSNIKVTLKNGDMYIFDSEERIIGIKTEDYNIYYDYNVSESEKERIRQLLDLNENVDVNFAATTEIKGEALNYYSVGYANISNDVNFPINFSKQYQNFPKEVLAEISSSVFGIILGDREISPYNPLEGNYGAYATSGNSDGEKYIFVPNSNDANSDYYKYNTPLHEMSHIIQSSIEIDEIKLKNLYEEYKEVLPTLEKSCYKSNNYDETPNKNEFFADAVTNYYLNTIELERYLPEVYNFIDEIFG